MCIHCVSWSCAQLGFNIAVVSSTRSRINAHHIMRNQEYIYLGTYGETAIYGFDSKK